MLSRRAAVLLALLAVVSHPTALVAADAATSWLEYRPGRGLRVGETGLTIGGFATAEAERLENGDSRGGVEGLHLFLFYDPAPFMHLFSELTLEGLMDLDSAREGVRASPRIDVDRLYADLGSSDQAQLRVGQFLTPFGLWNPAPADPLVWTTSDPLIVEEVFDDTVTGAMFHGRMFRGGGALSYALYATFLDPITPAHDTPRAQHSAGARLEWASLAGWSVGASSFASQRPSGVWNHLGGVDGLWRPHERVELSAEALFGEGSRADGMQWGLYAQAVVETVRTIHLVGRYEHYEPPAPGRAIDLFVAGITWAPVYSIRLKVDYRLADHADDISAPGLRASFSILF